MWGWVETLFGSSQSAGQGGVQVHERGVAQKSSPARETVAIQKQAPAAERAARTPIYVQEKDGPSRER